MPIIKEVGMHQMIFWEHCNSPDEEVFTTQMKDLILTSGPAGFFGTVAAILTPFVDCHICEITTAIARLGDIEIRQKDKVGVARPLKATPSAHPWGGRQRTRLETGTIKVSWRQM